LVEQLIPIGQLYGMSVTSSSTIAAEALVQQVLIKNWLVQLPEQQQLQQQQLQQRQQLQGQQHLSLPSKRPKLQYVGKGELISRRQKIEYSHLYCV
jgi:hypothetical protein